MSILHTQPLGLYSKILAGNLFVHRYFSPPPLYCLSHQLFRWSTRTTTSTLRTTLLQHNNAENNNAAIPPTTLEQVLMMQAQMLQTMQQTMVNM
jgi:hypothetical protein